MRTELDGSTTPAPAPGNIFTPEYLALLSPCEDEPVPATEAGIPVPTSDPWHLEPHPMEEGWAVLRQGTSLFSTPPHASFKQIDFARLAAAVIPSTEKPPRYRLGQEHGDSERIRPPIPTRRRPPFRREGGHPFRDEGGHRSDVKAATF